MLCDREGHLDQANTHTCTLNIARSVKEYREKEENVIR